MAITGKLQADFASFYTAVQQAEVSLKSFESGAGKVEGSLNRMVDSFSGRKVLSEATIATEAVERIGGASRLTEAQQRRVNATVTEAIAQYAALGQTAPANMLALAEATKKVEAPTEGLNTKMLAFGTAIGTMAANAVAALGRLVIDGLQAVVAGIGELISSGARLAGIENSFQTLSASVNSTGEAMLGAMRTGTRGLVTDLDLMGAANKAILLGLPVTAGEMGDLAATAATLGRAMGLTANQAFGDLITALGRSSPMILDNLGLSVKVGEANEKYAAALGKTAEELTDAEKKTAFYNAAMDAARAKVEALGQSHLTLGEHLQTAGVWWTNFKEDLAIAIARSPVLGAGLQALGQSLTAAFGGSQEALIKKIIVGVNALAVMVVDAGLILVEWGRTGAAVFGALQVPINAVSLALTFVVERFAAGLATMADLASRLPGVGGAFDGVAAATRNAATVWAEARTEAGRQLESSLALATGQGVVHRALDTATNALTSMKAAMVEATHSTRAQREELEKSVVIHGNAIAMWAAEEAEITKASGALKKFWEEVAKFEKNDKWLPPFTGLLTNLDRTITTLAESTKGMSLGMRFFSETIENAVVPALKKTEEGIAKVSLSWSQAMDLVRQGQGTMGGTVAGNSDFSSAKRAEIQKFWDEGRYFGPSIGGSSTFRGTGPNWAALGFRASGGDVSAGSSYMVGERGPELFVPSSSGAILPNGAGGGVVLHNHFHISGGVIGTTLDALARAVAEAQMSAFMRAGVRLPAGA